MAELRIKTGKILKGLRHHSAALACAGKNLRGS
jgi:hypothetical protein